MFEEIIKEKLSGFIKILEKQNEDLIKYKEKINIINENRKSDQEELV